MSVISLDMANPINNATTSPLPEDVPILNIQNIYGYPLIGSFFLSAVWGVSCLQLFIFYMNSEHDSALLKTILAFLWAFDTANVILILKSNYPILILHYGIIANDTANKIPPELLHHIWVEFAVAVVVQLYFIRRIHKFSTTMLRGMKSKLMLGVITLLIFLVIAQTVFMILYIVYSYGQTVAVLGNKRQFAINLTTRGLSVVVDICIAVAMVYLLRRKSNFARTRRMISRLMIVTVSSGSLTAVFSVIILILVGLSRVMPCDYGYTLKHLRHV